MSYRFRYLTQEDVIRAGGLNMRAAIHDMEEVLRLLATGQSILPTKVTLRFGDVESEKTLGYINAMPGYVGGDYDIAGLKWVSVMPRNPSVHGMPASTSILILNDPHTGFPVAIMDGTLIYPMRTGAVSGIVARHFARHDSRIVGLAGTGAQAIAQLMALDLVLPQLEKAMVYDKDSSKAQAFCNEWCSKLKMSLITASSLDEVVQHADILVSTIPGDNPVILRGHVPKGLLFLQIAGALCEYPVLLEFDKLVTDNWTEIQHRGVITLALAKSKGFINDGDIYADIGEIVAGKKSGRQTAEESIYFGQVGMGIEDIAVAWRVFRQAEQESIGSVLDLWDTPAFT